MCASTVLQRARPPRALARQCRFTTLYTVAPRSADVQDGSGPAAKEGGGRCRGEGDISAIWAGKFYFYTPLESTEDDRNSVKKNTFGRHTEIKSSDLTCVFYAARVNLYKKKGGNILCKISARWMCPKFWIGQKTRVLALQTRKTRPRPP
jgi:hypothetical protein